LKDYIFKRDASENLEFHGDFEGLYLNDEDPWGQSATNREEYLISRKSQLSILQRYKPVGSLLDIGCGLGITTDYYSKMYKVAGMDISQTAVKKAKERYPNIPFFCHDIRRVTSEVEKYDFVILNQALWYVLKEFDQVLQAITGILKNDGCLLISNFIFDRKDQQFGNEYFSGHLEILSWVEREAKDKNFVIDSYLCERLDQKYFDFHAILKIK